VIPLPDSPETTAAFDDFLAQNAKTLAAIIIEPLVQGAGGMILHKPAVLKHLREAADAYGLTLIFDEIFTGFGRTGTMFAFQQAGVTPDIITLSKALTGGTSPLAATIASDELFEAFLSNSADTALMHGPTFMANPLGCAAANASLDLFETEPRLEQASAISAQLRAKLFPCWELPGVKSIRVLGAIGVVEMHHIANPSALRAAFLAENVWIRPFRNIVYLTPALTITGDELSQLTKAIYKVLRLHGAGT
jgi:adenosylmethionine-8-amino-7-oxononanoate aminotransferase